MRANQQSILVPSGPPPFAMTVREAVYYVGLSKATLYRLAREGRLELKRVRGRTLVLRSDLERLLTERQ